MKCKFWVDSDCIKVSNTVGRNVGGLLALSQPA
jgi:hypothetical protein